MEETTQNKKPYKNHDYHHLATSYLAKLFDKDADAAIAMLLNAVQDGLQLKELYLQVLQPAQYDLGRLWQAGKISVAEEHYCTAATQQVMAHLYPRIFASPKNGKVLVATCIKGELHEVGLRMVADIFELNGWDTHFYSSDTPAEQIVQAVCDYRANLLAISATLEGHVGSVKDLLESIRSTRLPEPVKIMVGGYPFNADPELWRKIGADGTASEADAAVREGNRLCMNA